MTTIYRAKDYARLRAQLSIDLHDLTGELVKMPALLMETCECAGEAMRARDKASFDHKTGMALAAAEMRGEVLPSGKSRSEASINSELPLHPRVIEYQEALEEAGASATYWNALVEGMRAKQSSLKRLSDLTITGYLSTSSAYRKDSESTDPVVSRIREEQVQKRKESVRVRLQRGGTDE